MLIFEPDKPDDNDNDNDDDDDDDGIHWVNGDEPFVGPPLAIVLYTVEDSFIVDKNCIWQKVGLKSMQSLGL